MVDNNSVNKRAAHKYTAITFAKTFAIPIIVFVIMNIASYQYRNQLMLSQTADIKNLFRTIIITFCFALALSANFPLGRMDLSAGAQMYMGCIIGGNIALLLGFSSTGILIFSMIVGMLCGLIVGTMFVTLRILPMVLGIGMTLIFETISFAAFDQEGITLYGHEGTELLSNIAYILVISIILTGIVTYLFNFSSFGYRRRAIQGSQRIAGDFGINIYINCVQCYIIAGALLAASGVFKTAYQGSLTPVLGMSSNGTLFSYMFPMMLGTWIGSFSGNPVLGVFIGSTAVSIFRIGLSKIGLDSSWQSLIVYIAWVIFMVIRFNWPRVDYIKMKKKRIELHRKTLKDINAAAV